MTNWSTLLNPRQMTCPDCVNCCGGPRSLHRLLANLFSHKPQPRFYRPVS